MIAFEAVAGQVPQAQSDLLVLTCFAGRDGLPEPGPGCGEAAAALGIDLPAVLRARGFAGEIGDTFATLTLGRLASAGMLVIGLGARADAGPGAVRQAAMRAAAEMTSAAAITVVLQDRGATDGSALAAAFAEGLLLGAYQFDRYRRLPVTPGRPHPATELVRVLADGSGTTAVAAGLRRGQALASLTNWVRDLVNASPSETTPDDMAQRAREVAGAHGLTCSVLGSAESCGPAASAGSSAWARAARTSPGWSSFPTAAAGQRR